MQARERRIRDHVATSRCEHCGADYATSRVHILARRSAAWVVLVACSHCLRQAILFVSFPPSGKHPHLSPHRGAPDDTPPTSLSAHVSAQHCADRFPAPDTQPISARDVTEMHQFLRAFDGDFKRIFG